MQQHLVNATGVEGNAHFLGQLLRFLLCAAPQRLHRKALVFQQRDDDTGREAGAEHAHPGKHGCSGPPGSALVRLSSSTRAHPSRQSSTRLVAVRQPPCPGQGARVPRAHSAAGGADSGRLSTATAAVSATRGFCPSRRRRRGPTQGTRGPEAPRNPGSGGTPVAARASSVRPVKAAPWSAHPRARAPAARV